MRWSLSKATKPSDKPAEAVPGSTGPSIIRDNQVSKKMDAAAYCWRDCKTLSRGAARILSGPTTSASRVAMWKWRPASPASMTLPGSAPKLSAPLPARLI